MCDKNLYIFSHTFFRQNFLLFQGKKKEGNAAKYVTRSQAVKHLQVNLPLFRSLHLSLSHIHSSFVYFVYMCLCVCKNVYMLVYSYACLCCILCI